MFMFNLLIAPHSHRTDPMVVTMIFSRSLPWMDLKGLCPWWEGGLTTCGMSAARAIG